MCKAIKPYLVSAFSFLCAVSMFGSSHAQTYSTTQIIVNGQAYALSVDQGSFDTVNALYGGNYLTGQPWWTGDQGDNQAAIDFRDALAANSFEKWQALVTEFGLTSQRQQYNFGYASGNLTYLSVSTDPNSPTTGEAVLVGSSDTETGSGFTYHYFGAVAVPEINGPVLAQVTLVLGSMLLWLRTRRSYTVDARRKRIISD